MLLRLLLLSLTAALAGCGTVADPSTWWADEDTGPKPTELQDITNRIAIDRLWGLDTGDGTDGQTLGLAPYVTGDRVYLADTDGKVLALAAGDGKRLWEVELKDRLTGGPGAGEGLVLVGGSEGQVIALDQDSGQERWRAQLTSEVLSAPAVDLRIVVARAGDGRVFGIDADGGNVLWRMDQDIPVLTLRGTGAPVVSGGRVLVGLENGRLMALDIDRGQTVWETVITVPSGRTELERIADIDGTPLIVDRTVYVATYQGQVAAVGEASGRPIWQRKLSAYAGLASDGRQLYVSDEHGALWALDARSGEPKWSSESLAYRRLSAPATIGGQVVVGDFEGYLHFFDASSGELTARTRVGSAPIVAPPVARDGRLYVLGSAGDFAVLTLAGDR